MSSWENSEGRGSCSIFQFSDLDTTPHCASCQLYAPASRIRATSRRALSVGVPYPDSRISEGGRDLNPFASSGRSTVAILLEIYSKIACGIETDSDFLAARISFRLLNNS